MRCVRRSLPGWVVVVWRRSRRCSRRAEASRRGDARLDANMRTATTPATPNTAPRYAERTGTAVLPRPGSSAIRRPLVAVGRQTCPGCELDDRRRCVDVRPRRVERGAPGVAERGDDARSTKTTRATATTPSPGPRPVEVEAGVGIGAAGDTDGNNGDAATAPSTARSPPPAAISSAGWSVDQRRVGGGSVRASAASSGRRGEARSHGSTRSRSRRHPRARRLRRRPTARR